MAAENNYIIILHRPCGMYYSFATKKKAREHMRDVSGICGILLTRKQANKLGYKII